jgi:hypothetical protein
MFLYDRLNDTQSFKGGISEVTFAIVGSGRARVTVSAFRGDILGFVFSREKTTGQWVVDDYIETVPVTGGNKFSLDVACYRSC